MPLNGPCIRYAWDGKTGRSAVRCRRRARGCLFADRHRQGSTASIRNTTSATCSSALPITPAKIKQVTFARGFGRILITRRADQLGTTTREVTPRQCRRRIRPKISAGFRCPRAHPWPDLGLAGGVEVELTGDTVAASCRTKRSPTLSHHPFPPRAPRCVRIAVHLSGCRLRTSGGDCFRGAGSVSGAAAAGTADVPRHADDPARRERAPARRIRTRSRGSPHACVVTTVLIGERSGVATPTTPRAIAADERPRRHRATWPIYWVKATSHAAECGARQSSMCWMRWLRAARRDGMPAASAGQGRNRTVRLRLGRRVAAAFGRNRRGQRALVCRCDHGRGRAGADPGAASSASARFGSTPPPLQKRRMEPPTVSEQMIVDRPMVPVLRLTRFPCPDEFGRMQMLDALLLEFDYDGGVMAFERTGNSSG